ncbi:hypothetical protein [Mesonia aquimarina]|uniref:hypothetical protein n=1 Tax=Mesonia aquimarina TaxID=1504967 RepID=UPI0013CE8E64|nr:hypothetical protein [Mesonia aquimarina]
MQQSNTGLNGFFGDLWNSVKSSIAKNLAKIGGALGFLIGGPIGSAIGYGVGQYFQSRILNFKDQNNGSAPGAMAPKLTLAKEPTKEEVEELKKLEKWVEKTFKPYIYALGKTIKGSQNTTYLKSAEYRSRINKVIESLSVAHLYYTVKRKELGLNGVGFEGADYSQDETKPEIINTFLTSLRESYIEALKKVGVTAQVKTVTLQGSKYLGKTPELLNWNKDGKTSFEVFVEPGTGKKPTRALQILQGNGKNKGGLSPFNPNEKVFESLDDNQKLVDKGYLQNKDKGSVNKEINPENVEGTGTYQPTIQEPTTTQPEDQTKEQPTEQTVNQTATVSEEKKNSGLWWKLLFGGGVIYLIAKK